MLQCDSVMLLVSFHMLFSYPEYTLPFFVLIYDIVKFNFFYLVIRFVAIVETYALDVQLNLKFNIHLIHISIKTEVSSQLKTQLHMHQAFLRGFDFKFLGNAWGFNREVT